MICKFIESDGVVTEVLPNAMFRIKTQNGQLVLAHTAGPLRRGQVKVLCGDKVKVSVSPYDLTRGRVTYRYNPKDYENKSSY